MSIKRIIAIAGMLIVFIFFVTQASYAKPAVLYYYSEEHQEMRTLEFEEAERAKKFNKFCITGPYFSKCGEDECTVKKGKHKGAHVEYRLVEEYDSIKEPLSKFKETEDLGERIAHMEFEEEDGETKEVSFYKETSDTSSSSSSSSKADTSSGPSTGVIVLGVILGLIFIFFSEAGDRRPHCSWCKKGRLEIIDHLGRGPDSLWKCTKCGREDVF